MWTIRQYKDRAGHTPFAEWREELKDRQGKLKVDARINRMAGGNFGDHKVLQDGVSELKIDWGPGYRVYYARAGSEIILLLCAGDKSTQDDDVKHAVLCWKDWQERKAEDARQEPRRIHGRAVSFRPTIRR